MVYRVLHFLARFAETPLIVLAIITASLWLDSWLGIPVGFVSGRALYYPIKLGIAVSAIGPGWGKCWGEMIRLDVSKISIGRNAMGIAIIYFSLGMIIEVIGAAIDSKPTMWLGFSLAVWVGTNHMFATMPAVMLFLGRSSPETNDFLMELRLRVFPFRMTSLLDAHSSREQLSFRQKLGDFDNVRVGRADGWFEVVTRLATITPILILDCRQDSDSVAAEIELLSQPVFAIKTLVITDSDGRTAAIDAAIDRGVLVPPTWRLLNFSTALTELPQFCRDPEFFSSHKTSSS